MAGKKVVERAGRPAGTTSRTNRSPVGSHRGAALLAPARLNF
jgi:hypothetical protein